MRTDYEQRRAARIERLRERAATAATPADATEAAFGAAEKEEQEWKKEQVAYLTYCGYGKTTTNDTIVERLRVVREDLRPKCMRIILDERLKAKPAP